MRSPFGFVTPIKIKILGIDMRALKVAAFFLMISLCIGCAVAGHSSEHCHIGDYLRTNPGWKVVAEDDLPSDDQVLWKKYHGGFEPGVAVVDLDGSGNKACAVSLIQKRDGKTFEQLVLLKRTSKQLVKNVIVRPHVVVSPFVVWRAAPGQYVDLKSGNRIVIQNDSIVYEKMESTSTQFYHVKGKLHSLLATD